MSVDDFHQVRTVRYRRGRSSPEGFWLDSYDYDRFRAEVLDPLGPNASRQYSPIAHDLATDAVLPPRYPSILRGGSRARRRADPGEDLR